MKSVQKKHINHTPHAHPQSPAQFLRGDNTVKIVVGLGARSARSRWGGDAAYTCCGVWVGNIRFACRRESRARCVQTSTHVAVAVAVQDGLTYLVAWFDNLQHSSIIPLGVQRDDKHSAHGTAVTHTASLSTDTAKVTPVSKAFCHKQRPII